MDNLLLATFNFFSATPASVPAVLQLDTMQAFVGVAVVLVAVGAAWGTLKNSVSNIAGSIAKMEKSMKELHDSISDHRADITGLKTHTKYGIPGSPMIPSDEGRRVLESSGFNAQYPQLKKIVFEILDKKKPRTLYDYENGAYEAFESIRDNPLIDPLKDYAVNHPGETLELIFRIGSWVVRDDYATYKGTPTKHNESNNSGEAI